MRQVQPSQLQLGETDIANIKFDPRSRDDIPQLLRGLQFLYTNDSIREEVFGLLQQVVPENTDAGKGRPGMHLWQVLVMGTLRLNLNWDYDRLQEMANHHKTIREMLGLGLRDDDYQFALQTLKDNVSLLTPEILDEVNRVVVKAGHSIVKKKEGALKGRCDSFVVETNVHFPTDINLLWDAVRKAVTLTAGLSHDCGLSLWRQSAFNLRQFKKLYRTVQKLKHSTSKDADKKAQKQDAIVAAHEVYLQSARDLIDRVNETLPLMPVSELQIVKVMEIQRFVAHADRQMDQIRRRVVHGEHIPHAEKVFSLFQEHTEWVSKGKAGVPVELGLKVNVVEDHHGFILHHQVMEKQTDEQSALSIVRETQARFPDFRACSFDKGYHSPENQKALRELLEDVVLPKKGRCNKLEQARESTPEFQSMRRQHSAVESAINALEVHGLDRCPDHGIGGFKRYVALAVVARNIQKLGAELRKQERAAEEKRKRQRLKLAA
jgi:IS5 family transposase